MLDVEDKSLLWKLYMLERQEILRHKWLLSEKMGYDVGYEVALFSWLRNHKRLWWEGQMKNRPPSPFS